MLHSIEWYVERFGEMKIDFQTRRNRADNELLVFLLEDGPARVTRIRVDSSGVTVNGERGLAIYAAWNKGDRFERMYQAMGWIALPIQMSPPQMRWDDYTAIEDVPPLPLQGMLD